MMWDVIRVFHSVINEYFSLLSFQAQCISTDENKTEKKTSAYKHMYTVTYIYMSVNF